MAGFDNAGLTYMDFGFESAMDADEDFARRVTDLKNVQQQFKKFVREFNLGGFTHVYREQLLRRYNLGECALEVDIGHLKSFDESVADKLRKEPGAIMPMLEEAAREVADELTRPRAEGREKVDDVQVTLVSDEHAATIRHIKSEDVSRLVSVRGIVVAASQVRSKATRITLQCRTCRHIVPDVPLRPGLEGYALPRKCGAPQQGALPQKCPLDPYHMLPDRCKCVDFQVLKLQECPEDVPHGEMPRHMQIYCDRTLTDMVAPGNRVQLVGVYSIKKANKQRRDDKEKAATNLRAPYLRALGIHLDAASSGLSAESVKFSADEEQRFRTLAKQPNLYELICTSVAPSIYGSTDIKKAIACLLFGGSRKRLPDGLTRRGDVNVLLLGDPGTAKSQLLKFVEKVAPIAVYTSGKGSSAAGLTASVIRDPASRNFIMEGGAMVLADGGAVCIDEFDKMREDDRVAIHEAMEQQTISIAKAGITTTLNSRCSVLAAANSVYGRWDEAKGADNIDFMPTILSRFDMIFIIKDEHDEQRDKTLAKHVIQVHSQAVDSTSVGRGDDAELPLDLFKKFIAFCRSQCAPRLSAEASSKLVNEYVRMRNPANPANTATDGRRTKARSTIPITVRQLEAVVRLSEALAKMQLRPFAGEQHVDEALRLFRVSTIAAAATGNLAGVEGFTTRDEQETLSRIEKQIKKRFAIGTQVSEHIIVQDFVRQNYSAKTVQTVINAMVRRGELKHRIQRKMLFRVR